MKTQSETHAYIHYDEKVTPLRYIAFVSDETVNNPICILVLSHLILLPEQVDHALLPTHMQSTCDHQE